MGKVKLVGTSSNKDGLGATVRLTTSEGTQTKVHDGQSGYLSQSSKELYFGLGAADKVDQSHMAIRKETTCTV